MTDWRMRMRRWMLIAWLSCAGLTGGCATRPPASPAALPQLEPPAAATAPCEAYVLPPDATRADLDAGYVRRGAQIAACDAARRLALETLAAEHALEAEALRRAGWGRR
ncbi:MAG: hypothetical protein ACKN9P_08155 [Phenylobacterium sp.]